MRLVMVKKRSTPKEDCLYRNRLDEHRSCIYSSRTPICLTPNVVPLLLLSPVTQFLAVSWPPDKTAAVCCTSSPPRYCLFHALTHLKLANMSYTGNTKTESSILQERRKLKDAQDFAHAPSRGELQVSLKDGQIAPAET